MFYAQYNHKNYRLDIITDHKPDCINYLYYLFNPQNERVKDFDGPTYYPLREDVFKLWIDLKCPKFSLTNPNLTPNSLLASISSDIDINPKIINL